MANYLLKYKGKYRLLPKLDARTNDIPREKNGDISDGYDDIYISCRFGNEISVYGCDSSRRMWLEAYIPSISRGRNIIKEVKEKGIEYSNYIETDKEVIFRFKAKDIDDIAKLLKAKVSGANISPFSSKNLPQDKNLVSIPTDKMQEYKDIIDKVDKGNLLIIHRITNDFLANILEKRFRKTDKTFSYKTDIKQLKLSRLVKEYIYYKDMWQEYITYLDKEINKFLVTNN